MQVGVELLTFHVIGLVLEKALNNPSKNPCRPEIVTHYALQRRNQSSRLAVEVLFMQPAYRGAICPVWAIR
jgi:hypothetical protein